MTDLPQPPLAGMFPFYMAVDRDLRIVGAGPLMLRVCPETGAQGAGLLDCFSLQGEPARCSRLEDFSLLKSQTAIFKRRHSPDVLFKGTWNLVPDGPVLYFLGWPVIKDSARLSDLGVSPQEIPAHTMLDDLLLIQRVNRNTLADAQDLAHRLRSRATQLEEANTRLQGEIAERSEVQAALVASEANLRNIFEQASVGVALIDTCTGQFLRINKRYCEMVGYSIEDLQQSTFMDITHPEDLQEDLDHMTRLRAGELRQFSLEKRYFHKDGRTVWVMLNVAANWEPGDPPTTHVAVVQDITERKRAEDLIRKSERQSAMIVRTSPIAMAIANVAEGRFIEVNEALEKLFGFSRENILGKTSTEIGFWPSSDDRNRWLEKLHSQKNLSGYEIILRDKNGKNHDVLMSSTLTEYAGQTCVVNFILDITERKRAELELRVAATAFEAQEGMFITNTNMEILRINRAFTSITGYSTQEALGQTPRLFHSGRHDAAFFSEMLEKLHRTGYWQGEIWSRRKNGEVYPEWLSISSVHDSLGKIINYVASIADITSRKMAEEEIRHLAYFDPLTSLPNRRLLLDRLKQAMASGARSKRHCALLFIDLDNFKTLNDSLGHDTGDRLLIQVAERLVGCVREADTVARLGGDEFVVVLEDLGTNLVDASSQVEAAVEKILASLGREYRLDNYVIHSTPSIGITLFVDGSAGIDNVLKQADLAMYQAKAAGRNTWRFFDPKMQALASERAAIEHGLRNAIADRGLQLYYQPQITLDERLIGAEALLRWQHPRLGAVSPAQFIPVAEETGLILSIGNWVLQTACEQLGRWAGNPETAGLTLAVNVSARQFKHVGFVDQVLAAIDRNGIAPGKLKLELTESLLLDDLEETIAKMTFLKTMGIGFSLDDFGTGYSSLSYLKRLPLDQLKIDQSFVRDVLLDQNDAVIAKTIVALAQSLGLDVIAEGVENAGQFDFLASIGCPMYQGYFFGKPMEASALESVARSRYRSHHPGKHSA